MGTEAECTAMAVSVKAVEEILRYRFKDSKLLEDALTHPSCAGSSNYQRLEFLGDHVLGIAIANHVYLAYPELDPGQLSLLRSANISTEKLARVAVRHGLYRYVRHNTDALDDKVKDFVMAVQQEYVQEVYGGVIKAPKVLADIVESIAAALYVDCGLQLEKFWVIFRGLLEPIVTPDILKQQPQPVTMLFELCHKEGNQVEIRHSRNEDKNIASVYINGQLLVSSSSDQKEGARLHAAKAALQKLSPEFVDKKRIILELDEKNEIQDAKQKLRELCDKKKWPKPAYRIDKEMGPSHGRTYICSVQITTVDGVLLSTGNERTRVRDAEKSAASVLLCALQRSKFI